MSTWERYKKELEENIGFAIKPGPHLQAWLDGVDKEVVNCTNPEATKLEIYIKASLNGTIQGLCELDLKIHENQ